MRMPYNVCHITYRLISVLNASGIRNTKFLTLQPEAIHG